MKIKVCGMRNAENIVAIAALPIDYMGFIFYEKSQRYVTFLNVHLNVHLNVGRVQNPANVATDVVKKVGVFVNEKIDVILSKIIDYQLDAIQLHGNETNDFIKKMKNEILNKLYQSTQVPSFGRDLGKVIFKSISILEKSDFEKINDYPDADFLLLDTKTPQHGGSGQKFDWSLLENITFPKPFFLSGGINEDDAEAIKQLKIKNLYGIDINSKFEIEPALKDVEKVKRFVNSIRY